MKLETNVRIKYQLIPSGHVHQDAGVRVLKSQLSVCSRASVETDLVFSRKEALLWYGSLLLKILR